MKKLNQQEKRAVEELKDYLSASKCQYFLAYETGSQLVGLANEHSDVDFYVFYVPTKLEILTQSMSREQFVQLDNCEVKLVAIPEMFHLVEQGDPNVIETFFQAPLLQSQHIDGHKIDNQLANLAEVFYQNRNLLPYLSNGLFIKSCLWMMRKNIRKLRPSKHYLGNGTFGKTLFEYLKEYKYASKFLHQSQKRQVAETEKIFFPNEKEIAQLKKYKNMHNFDKHAKQQVLNKYDYKKLRQDYRIAKNRHVFSRNDKMMREVLQQLVAETPVYY
ncbi:hypothetical protein BGL34_06190 [Fructilactobacillus lindneri]|nr:nucleotidyltransferase domain-containing protein [Fructilactobacillus lindneri]ANZ57482.1 hypothetical protein AYR60_01125 [Fructilactobacillus lindneri]ANZ58750.1 hypothetical protein AYR59_01125 [Fructilactobacillus lindneri]POG97820.1 hypothetical protein BGL31_05655 [Fructilactobacillus lindneri]POG99153.1 hypothetical protein BGL32_05680 [Fructilactobacillus lindneri]POH01316.1 hypothetical protein BGL33_05845 [Fructilactobacillus lindneri]